MEVNIPPELLSQAHEWNELHRWERRQLAMALRSLGMSYGEIRALIPVPWGTLSNWVRQVPRTPDQVESIRRRTGPESQRGIPRDTHRRRREEIARIRRQARTFAEQHISDAFFVAGVTLYWGEGSKTRNYLDLTNADPATLRLFIRWVRRFLDPDARFTLAMHLHEGNDEATSKAFWVAETGLVDAAFTKTFVKPKGTGHRKNHLQHGVCRVRTKRAANHWNRVMTWIQVVSEEFGE